MKGIILAGGSGTRLNPITKAFSKQLLPIYNKPLIYYPLSILMLAKINEILIITTPSDQILFKSLLGDGENLGIRLTYLVQNKPKGIAEAFLIAEDFIGNDSVALILGDNIFYGSGLRSQLSQIVQKPLTFESHIFAYHVDDPERFGVVELDYNNNPVSIEEKPLTPKSNYCITGLYFYGNEVIQIAKSLEPSLRGELEISDINKIYLKNYKLNVNIMGRGYSWFDTGTADSLLEASNFVKIIETSQNNLIAALEEISYINGWISKERLLFLAETFGNSSYGKHLKRVYMEKIKY